MTIKDVLIAAWIFLAYSMLVFGIGFFLGDYLGSAQTEKNLCAVTHDPSMGFVCERWNEN